jgi:hypothetical protein
VRPGGDDDLLRIMSEIERGRREMREQNHRQQLMIDLVSFVLWISFGILALQSVSR